MRDRSINLAIETSCRTGSVTLGRGDEQLGTTVLPPQRRHRVDLMPTIDGMFAERDLTPVDLGEVYVSVGPGSFTGLRIGIATVRLLVQTLGVNVVSVPTLDVIAQNVDADAAERPLVCLNMKQDSVYCAVYQHSGEHWEREDEPQLRTVAQIETLAVDAVLGDPLPSLSDHAKILPVELAQPRSDVVWSIGRSKARAGQFSNVETLLPIYAREPEAVSLWRQRQQRDASANA